MIAHDNHVLAIKLEWPLYIVEVARLHAPNIFANPVCGRYTLFQKKMFALCLECSYSELLNCNSSYLCVVVH